MQEHTRRVAVIDSAERLVKDRRGNNHRRVANSVQRRYFHDLSLHVRAGGPLLQMLAMIAKPTFFFFPLADFSNLFDMQYV